MMLALFRRPRRAKPAARRPPARPRLELLEGRNCPSTPFVCGLTVAQAGGHLVRVTGVVRNEVPSGCVVTLGGQVSGTATPNMSGAFDVTLEASGLGTITAQATNCQGQTGNVASAVLANAPPNITSFSVTPSGSNYYVFSGTVSDEHAEGLTVTITAEPAVGLQPFSITVGPDGHFSCQMPSWPFQPGLVFADCTDAWGAAAAQVWYSL